MQGDETATRAAYMGTLVIKPPRSNCLLSSSAAADPGFQRAICFGGVMLTALYWREWVRSCGLGAPQWED